MVNEKITSKKRVFIGLLVFTVILLSIIAIGAWLIPYIGLENIHPALPKTFAAIIIAIISIINFGVLLLILTMIRKKEIIFAQRLRGVVIKILFPLIIFIGKIIGIPKEKIKQSFIEVNNQLVRSNASKLKPSRLLILIPHCLQDSDCQVRITSNVKNCLRCGKCKVKDLVELAERNNIHLSIATGGTLARRIIIEKKPQAIIAVACERDLTSGIQDSYPIPVLGILNERPFGPCINTQVDLEKVKEAINFFVDR